MIINTLKRLLNRRDREKTFHGYPVNGCITKGICFTVSGSPQKAQAGGTHRENTGKLCMSE